jgi:Lrp/AsnC family transcriptional regulator for asnA, asnC and gidA
MATKSKAVKKKRVNSKSRDIVTPKPGQQSFDDLSQKILLLLQEDGRRSFSSIARELQVSEGAVRSRVNYLEEYEHLRFLAVIDPVNVGYRCWAMLGLNVAPGTSPNDLAHEFASNPSAIWVGVVGGEFDIIVEVWTNSSDELQQFLEDYCYSNACISSVNTMVGMRIHKWGTPTA